MNIIVTYMKGTWWAWLSNDPDNPSDGNSELEAIGRLVLNNQNTLSISINKR